MTKEESAIIAKCRSLVKQFNDSELTVDEFYDALIEAGCPPASACVLVVAVSFH